MKRAFLVVIAILVTAFLFPVTSYADDASLEGGTGITAYPISNTQIEMEKEIIDITVKNGCSYVSCQFWFHNTGEKTRLLVGFPTKDPTFYDPENDSDEDSDEEHGDIDTQLYGFRTYIHGKIVPVKIKEGLKEEGNNAGDLYYPQWYTWKMNFGAGQRIKVVNKYSIVNSYDADTDSIYYILRSGSTWKGPVGKVTVRMKFKGYDMASLYFDKMPPAYIESSGTIVWEAKNIEPDQDIRAVCDRSDYWFVGNTLILDNYESELYDKMCGRLLNNFYAGHYNGVTWWGHRIIDRFGDNQPCEFCYLLGVSYFEEGNMSAAVSYLSEPDEDHFYLLGLYYKALIYKKTGNTAEFKGCLDELIKIAEWDKNDYDSGDIAYKDFIYLYLNNLYYEALLYHKSGDISGYKDCLDKLSAYDYSTVGDYTDNSKVYWLQLWAQSRLKDMGKA